MMPKPSTPDTIEYFSAIEDLRIDHQKLHSLPDILFIVFFGVICDVDSWEDFVLFAFIKGNYSPQKSKKVLDSIFLENNSAMIAL